MGLIFFCDGDDNVGEIHAEVPEERIYLTSVLCQRYPPCPFVLCAYQEAQAWERAE